MIVVSGVEIDWLSEVRVKNKNSTLHKGYHDEVRMNEV